MNRTTAHILASIVWLSLIPLLIGALALFGDFAVPPFAVAALSVWYLGLVAIFASWSLKDAPAHGKPRLLAGAFIAAFVLINWVAVIPYLFATRGARAGGVASLKFISMCLVAWFALPLVFRLFT